MRYEVSDNSIQLWFRYIERNRTLIELGNYEGLSRLINNDYSTYSGKTLEFYFKQMMQDIINGRCGWCGTDELYTKYHDQEWGRLVTDDKTLFEFLVLESAQAGLSWITILRKREGYRKAFCNFDAERVAQLTDEDVERLMQFDGIVKNRLKIKATITNARLFLALQKEFGSFYDYTLSFFPDRKPIDNTFYSLSEIPASSPQSDAMSKDMKKRGFKFFGSTICYAHLQAAGFVNDHLADCVCRKK